MPQDPMLFTHALARFRSRFPLGPLDRLNREHAFEVALALRHAWWSLDGALPRLALIKARGEGSLLHVCLERESDFFDLLGSNALTRFEESNMLSEACCEAELFDNAEDLRQRLSDAGYFVDHWDADPEEIASIRDGVAAAAQDFAEA